MPERAPPRQRRHARRIEQNRIRACDQRRNGARRVASIAFRYLQRKGGKVSSNPLFFQLLMAPRGPLFGARGQENLDRRPGEYHGAHVAPVGHEPGGAAKRRWRSSSAARTAGSAATFEASLPALSVRIAAVTSWPASQIVSSPSSVEPKRISRPARAGERRAVPEVDSGPAARQGDQSIQRTAIEQGPAERPCDRTAHGPLAGTRGPSIVMTNSALMQIEPHAAASSTKPGNEVATLATSRIEIGRRRAGSQC
jgi:hypothetical protein